MTVRSDSTGAAAAQALLRRARFLVAAAAARQLPPDEGVEVAFAGRSNAGKSTFINALTGQRQLARTSKAPGRTRQLVVFELSPAARLVDLPGYGYAKASREEQARWQRLIPDYLASRRALAGVVLLTDCRRPMGEADRQALDLLATAGLPCLLVLTKADKLSRGAAAGARDRLRRELAGAEQVAGVELFSSLRPASQEPVLACLEAWFAPALGSQKK